MHVFFIKNDHEDAEFAERECDAVPRVGDHMWLRRSNLNGIHSYDGYMRLFSQLLDR